MRKLASIRQVTDIEPIEGYDRIMFAMVDGWTVIIGKDQFKEGDKCVFFEIDSILPQRPEYEFLAKRKWRIKTQKMCKGQVLSQGLCMPLETCGLNSNLPYGEDVTERLGVSKHDPQTRDESWGNLKKRKRPPRIPKWLDCKLTRTIVNKVWNKLYPKNNRTFPDFIKRTEENRIQNVLKQVKKWGSLPGEVFICWEKLDGQSLTAYCIKEKGLFSDKMKFGVCSRNIHYPESVDNNWWNYINETQIQRSLTDYCMANDVEYAIQGELIGEGIQGNKYNIQGRKLYLFSIWDIREQKYLNTNEKIKVAQYLNIDTVPILNSVDVVNMNIDGWQEQATFMSNINGEVLAEGIVVRSLKDDSKSFKVVSNEWLLKYKE